MTTAIMTETNFDRTAGALIGLARAAEGLDLPAKMEPLLYSALSSLPQLHASGNSGNEKSSPVLPLHQAKAELVPDCAACQSPCGRTADYSMIEIYENRDGLGALRLSLLFSLSFIAAAAEAKAKNSGSPYPSPVTRLLLDGLFLTGYAFDATPLSAFLERIREVWKSL